MIDRFFACCDCKVYIECGGRWAFWQLEELKVVRRNHPVDVAAVLAADQYWNPPKNDESQFLLERVFPQLKAFLDLHFEHRVVFGERDYFAPFENDQFLDWMEVGYLPSLTPRYFVEVLGFTDWDQVRGYIEAQNVPPAWWEVTWLYPSLHQKARRKFEELVNSNKSSNRQQG
jgi:hypothetical protein